MLYIRVPLLLPVMKRVVCVILKRTVSCWCDLFEYLLSFDDYYMHHNVRHKIGTLVHTSDPLCIQTTDTLS